MNWCFSAPSAGITENRADLIESATPCHDAQMVGRYRVSNPVLLTVLAAESEDYTSAPLQLRRKEEKRTMKRQRKEKEGKEVEGAGIGRKEDL